MKKIVLLVVGLFLISAAFSQSTNYVLLEGDPSKAFTKFVAPELGADNNSTNTTVCLGAND